MGYRYSVWFEDVVSGDAARVQGALTRRSMLRKVRKGNALVRGAPVRFFGKVEDRRVVSE